MNGTYTTLFAEPLPLPPSPLSLQFPTSPTFAPDLQPFNFQESFPNLPVYHDFNPRPQKPTNKNNTFHISHPRRASISQMQNGTVTTPAAGNHHTRRRLSEGSCPDSSPRNMPRPPPKRHSHHQPVTKFNSDMWKESFRQSCMDRLFKEERFKAYQKHRGLDAMDTSDDNEETQQELINQIVTSEYQSHLALASQNPAYAQLLVQQGFPPFSQQPQELVQAVVQQIGQDVSLGQVAGYVDPGLAFAHGPEQPTSVIQQQWQPSGTMGAVPGSYVGPQWNQWRESN